MAPVRRAKSRAMLDLPTPGKPASAMSLAIALSDHSLQFSNLTGPAGVLKLLARSEFGTT
jgi:hypothetical protein